MKGWRRSVSALICVEGVRALNIAVDELTHSFKAWPMFFVIVFVIMKQFSCCRQMTLADFPDGSARHSPQLHQCSRCGVGEQRRLAVPCESCFHVS